MDERCEQKVRKKLKVNSFFGMKQNEKSKKKIAKLLPIVQSIKLALDLFVSQLF